MKPPTMIHTRLNCEHFPQTEPDFNLIFNEVNKTGRVRDNQVISIALNADQGHTAQKQMLG